MTVTAIGTATVRAKPRPRPADASLHATALRPMTTQINTASDRSPIVGRARRTALGLLFGLLSLAWASSASAQAEWVKRVDANGNGYIEPSEVSERARYYFERFATPAGIDLKRTNSVARLEEAAKRYCEQERGRSSSSSSS